MTTSYWMPEGYPRIIDIRGYTLVIRCSKTLRDIGHMKVKARVLSLAVFERDGASPIILAGCSDGSVRAWCGVSLEHRFTRTGTNTLACGIGHMSVYTEPSEGLVRVVSGSMNRKLEVLDGRSGDLVRSIDGFDQGVSALSNYFDPASGRQRLVVGGYGGKVCVYDAEEGKLLHDLKSGDFGQITGLYCFKASWALGRPHVVSVCFDGTIWVWDAEAGRLVHKLQGQGPHMSPGQYIDPTNPLCLYIEPKEGRLWIVMATTRAGTIKIWDAKDGTLLQTMVVGRIINGVHTYEAADGSLRLLLRLNDGTYQVWDPESGPQ